MTDLTKELETVALLSDLWKDEQQELERFINQKIQEEIFQ